MKSSFIPKPQVLVVEASAGSGKTYELSRRYVQLSLALAAAEKSPSLQSILAITFTNKATWAMKSRILDFLKRIALKQLKPFEVSDILSPLGLDETQASRLAFVMMNNVIRQYHYFQVQTIDSFINVLLVGCSFKIGLSARFKIRRNSKEYLGLSLDELLEEAQNEGPLRRSFENFVRQYLFLENRSGWFPKEDLLKVISELFRQYNTYQKPLLIYPVDGDLMERKRSIYALIQELKEICPPQTNKRFLEHLESFEDKGPGGFDVDDLKPYWSRADFPVNKGGVVSPRLEDLWGRLHREIRDLCALEAYSMFNPYVVVFKELLSCFARLSKRDDILFLEELNRRAALLFEDNVVSVEELYFRLSARFRHYLMDEFQDTSLSQWRNLSLMVHEALAGGGSLFYVGDKKQAIYAFRGGESRLFDALQTQLVCFNVQNKSLDKNYRSCPAIVSFNNRVFGLDNLHAFLSRRSQDALDNKRQEIAFSQVDFEIIANTFAGSHQMPVKESPQGLVRVSYLQGRVKSERLDEVRGMLIPLVIDLKARFALKDIAILTRGNEEVEDMTRWLLQEGINAQSERSSDIKNNPLIEEILNLLTFLSSPVDNNAFAKVCLGELMPAASGLSSALLRDFLFSCADLARQNKELFFYKCFQEAFPQVWEDFFEEFLSQAGACPLYDLTAGIIERFGCEKHFPGFQGFFMHLLELIKKQEAESCDLAYFLDYYEGLEGEGRFVPMGQMDAVRILTVHKAKGLEFPAVIVPFLEMDIKAGSGGRDGSQAYMLDIKEEGMGLIRLKDSYRQFCPQLQERYEQEYRKAFLVELNSAYVALTRAVEELYVFVPSKVGNTVNPARFLIPEDCTGSGVPSERQATPGSGEMPWKIKPFVLSRWSGLQEEFLDHPAVSAQAARKGEYYHAVLMQVGRINEENAEQIVKEACKINGDVYQLNGDVYQLIYSFINREEVRRFFYLPEEALVFCEKEFVNAYGDTKRIDRLIVLQDEVWVVDYKLSPGAEEENKKQMQGYLALVKQFYPEHKVSGHVVYIQNG